MKAKAHSRQPIRKVTALTALSESAQRSVPDRETGGRRYKGVILIKAGLGNRRDKNYYPPETLRAATESGMFEGLRAFADHPDAVSDEIQPERTVRDLVGIYENAQYDDVIEGVRADLVVLKSHNWLSNTIDELISLGHADKIGLSINGRGQTEPGRRTIHEADGDVEMDVNNVRRLVDVRSTDVVTEAGAGGGFDQLLESARRAKESTHMSRKMGRKELQAALREARADGDTAKVKRLTKALEALSDEGKDKGKAKAKPAPKRRAAAAEDDHDEDLEEADDEEDLDDEVDPDEELEEAVDRAKGDDEDDDVDDLDEAEDEDDEDLDDEDEDDLEEADDEDELSDEERSVARAAAMNAVDRLRAQTERSARTREAAIKGGVGRPTGTIKGGAGGSFVKTSKMRKKGSKPPMSAKGYKGKRTTGGAQTIESGRATALAVENARLRRALEKRDRKISNMSESLRARMSADRAKKLLKESGLPKQLLPSLVDDLIGLSDEEMKRYIQKTERIIESVANSVKSDFEDDFDEVEGAGSSLRESFGGGRRSAGGEEDILTELGFTLRDE